ncbi:hypothetical protein BN938_0644 [Mucinivorans hirudinis]|uniref:Uncharacterized protein n=1 Tax=Mucinivorans hirudinis TaxID=1433126 RepID=A0A060RBI1_9BACT|nr:hypothetical protein BN938_0644 [Mucinivorans hirudinis]
MSEVVLYYYSTASACLVEGAWSYLKAELVGVRAISHLKSK